MWLMLLAHSLTCVTTKTVIYLCSFYFSKFHSTLKCASQGVLQDQGWEAVALIENFFMYIKLPLAPPFYIMQYN